MLYSRKVLKDITLPYSQIPLERYLHKYEIGELKKLKMHEREFLFEHMILMNNDEMFNRKATFDLRKIEEAKEYLFFMIILTYHAKDIIDFDRITFGYNEKKISADENQKNKRFFYEYMSVWTNQVKSRKGVYFSQIANALQRKLKDWEKIPHKDQITLELNQQKITYIKALFFHIYYYAKLYFDEKKNKYEEITINGFKVRFDIYSFIHIMSRHYYPDMNADIGISLNSSIPEIDLYELPTSILDLIKPYFLYTILTKKIEFLLLTIQEEKYILWIKYCTLDGTNKERGFQVRSFYKCEAQHDLNKFIDKTEIKHTNNISFFI